MLRSCSMCSLLYEGISFKISNWVNLDGCGSIIVVHINIVTVRE